MPPTRSPWTLTVAPAWRHRFPDAASALAAFERDGFLVHENDRGATFQVLVDGQSLVAKRSTRQESGLWARITSVYRHGEGWRAYQHLAGLRAAGIPVPEPVLAIERRRFGFVVGSWHAYRYVEGVTCSCAEAPLVARALASLHDRGWVHRDPHVRNFIREGDRLWIIDCLRARPWRSRYARWYDVVLLNKCCPGARVHYPGFDERDVRFRLAQRHNDWIVRWRRFKRRARQAFGLGPRDRE